MYQIDYTKLDLPRWEVEDRAIDDLKSYLGEHAWNVMREEASKATNGTQWQGINGALGFFGVSGYPVHAFGRRFALAAYRDWMRTGDEEGVYETDEHGFALSKGNG